MLVEHNKVKVKWSNTNKEHFLSKGYPFTKIRGEFEVDVKDLSLGSRVLVEFICDYCHGKNQTTENSKRKKYGQYISSRKLTNTDCCNHPECRGAKISASQKSKGIKFESILGIKHPKLVGEWSNKNLKSPFDYSFGDATIVWWECPDCDSAYDMKINSRTGQGLNCPYCSGHRVNHTNSLASLKPEIAAEWHPTENGELSPHEVTIRSNKKVWWKCKKGHEWQDPTAYRTYSERKCPYCFGRKVNYEKSLVTTHPNLIKEIHPTLNSGFDPTKVSHGSGIKIWWICEKEHKWETSIYDRTYYKTNCPYCSNKKVCKDNCLSTLNPKLTEEWDYIMNKKLTPQDVVHKSKKIVWWKCKTCKHSWKAAILNRSYGNGCPQCNESKGEKKVRLFLETCNVKFIPQYEFRDLAGLKGRLLKFDFAILDDLDNLKLLIEYDGEFHFGKVYDDDDHETCIEHDRRKNEYCKNNNIPLLRIPYWEFNNIEEILTNELNNYNLLG